MTKIKISILDPAGNVKTTKKVESAETREMTVEMMDFCHLATQNLTLEDGDVIEVTLDEPNQYLVVKLDDTVDSSLVYIKDQKFTYQVTLSENRVTAQSPAAFQGKVHYFAARKAYDFEIQQYQNLALNTHDQKEFEGAYPHASANVETRDEAVFFACNAIDNVLANHSHGNYPYQSWGINRQADAALTIDFGRSVEIDEVAFTLRADFPHDSYWEEVSLEFSDGTKESFPTEKSDLPQFFKFAKRTVTSVTFTDLKKTDDESPFPALTQIAVFGKNVL